MNVVLIGETTSGKYTGSITLHDAKRSYDWAIQPIVLKSANANGDTEFRDGFAPDYLVKDDLMTPLGDVNEGMLAEALRLISGLPADQMARKRTYGYPEGAEYLTSGGRIPVEKEQQLWIDNIEQ
jgi:hypothetical protein